MGWSILANNTSILLAENLVFLNWAKFLRVIQIFRCPWSIGIFCCQRDNTQSSYSTRKHISIHLCRPWSSSSNSIISVKSLNAFGEQLIHSIQGSIVHLDKQNLVMKLMRLGPGCSCVILLSYLPLNSSAYPPLLLKKIFSTVFFASNFHQLLIWIYIWHLNSCFGKFELFMQLNNIIFQTTYSLANLNS